MAFNYDEPIPSDFETFEDWEQAHEAWESAMDDYCEEFLENRRIS